MDTSDRILASEGVALAKLEAQMEDTRLKRAHELDMAKVKSGNWKGHGVLMVVIASDLAMWLTTFLIMR